MTFAGAKLCLLRERLRAQMKVKREEARKKRFEMYELDNEEGFGAEEEEAELTDQTDTDEEEVEEEEEEEEEMMEEEDVEKDKEVCVSACMCLGVSLRFCANMIKCMLFFSLQLVEIM